MLLKVASGRALKACDRGRQNSVSSYDDRVFIGFELGYFEREAKGFRGAWSLVDRTRDRVDWREISDAKIGSFLGACNVTLRHDLHERAFVYGGFGAGIARSRLVFYGDIAIRVTRPPVPLFDVAERFGIAINRWRFLGQAFAGFGVHLNDNLQLTSDYRLRWMPDSFRREFAGAAPGFVIGEMVKNDILHAAEVGLMYQF